MIKINEFAFCFFSSDINDVVEQEKELTLLSDKYQIERWYRHDRNISRYTSFSQMVNDAIDDTDSEFMIFCNPKTKFKSSDIEFIIEKLSNGYCFASVVSFGFFGFSKELIRQIDMLDERFIGGEYEDDDFAIRLSKFGKAVWWGYDLSKYNLYHSKSQNLKHITHSIFMEKYKIINNEIIINNDLFKHKKISKRHRKNNEKIFESWLDSSFNYSCEKFLNYLTNNTIISNDMIKIEKKVDVKLIFNKKNFEVFTELLCDENIRMSVVFLKNLNNERTLLDIINVTNNTWHIFNLFDNMSNDFYSDEVEVRVFIGDNQILNTVLKINDSINFIMKIPIQKYV